MTACAYPTIFTPQPLWGWGRAPQIEKHCSNDTDTRISKTNILQLLKHQTYNILIVPTYLFKFDIAHRNLKFSFYDLGYLKNKNIKFSIIYSFISIFNNYYCALHLL